MPLPTDLAEAHALILRQREELAAAQVRALGADAMIAHLKLMLAKLRREQYGQSSERGRKVLDQLELQLEELEADASENTVVAEEKAADGAALLPDVVERLRATCTRTLAARIFACPSSLSLLASGAAGPMPTAVICAAGMP